MGLFKNLFKPAEPVAPVASAPITNPIKDLKAELKAMAAQIKENRPKFRQGQSEISKKISTKSVWDLYGEFPMPSYTFRHKHIVYCLLRGRTREQIENPTRNKPNEPLIKKLLEEYNGKLEAFRRSQTGSV
jgi:hypothetical protein